MGIDIRKDDMEAFAAECEAIVDELNTDRGPILNRYTGTTDDYTPVKWRNGIKVTLGTVDYPYPGRDAGEAMADRIGAAGYSLVSVEEGVRALASIVRHALADLEGRDSVSAEELSRFIGAHDTARPLTNLEHSA